VEAPGQYPQYARARAVGRSQYPLRRFLGEIEALIGEGHTAANIRKSVTLPAASRKKRAEKFTLSEPKLSSVLHPEQ
jgi:hypothetical protein